MLRWRRDAMPINGFFLPANRHNMRHSRTPPSRVVCQSSTRKAQRTSQPTPSNFDLGFRTTRCHWRIAFPTQTDAPMKIDDCITSWSCTTISIRELTLAPAVPASLRFALSSTPGEHSGREFAMPATRPPRGGKAAVEKALLSAMRIGRQLLPK
jgi:hypothetical protein